MDYKQTGGPFDYAWKAPQTVSVQTEQRTRQKAKKKAGHVAQKKPQVVDDHHDDCGEHFGPLGEDFLVENPFDGESELSDGSGEEQCCVLATDLTQQDSADGSAMSFEDLESLMAWNSSQRKGFTMSPSSVAGLATLPS